MYITDIIKIIILFISMPDGAAIASNVNVNMDISTGLRRMIARETDLDLSASKRCKQNDTIRALNEIKMPVQTRMYICRLRSSSLPPSVNNILTIIQQGIDMKSSINVRARRLRSRKR